MRTYCIHPGQQTTEYTGSVFLAVYTQYDFGEDHFSALSEPAKISGVTGEGTYTYKMTNQCSM
jgi:hypothetical protein